MATDPSDETDRVAYITVRLPVYGSESHVHKTFNSFTTKLQLQFPSAKTTLEKITMSKPDT